MPHGKCCCWKLTSHAANPNIDPATLKTARTHPVFPISQAPGVSCFCLSDHGERSRQLLVWRSQSKKKKKKVPPQLTSCVCPPSPLRTPQTAPPTPLRSWTSPCSRSSPRPFRRDTSACQDIITTCTTPSRSPTTTIWIRWDTNKHIYALWSNANKRVWTEKWTIGYI